MNWKQKALNYQLSYKASLGLTISGKPSSLISGIRSLGMIIYLQLK